jgi:hypothetical protein
MSLSTFLKDCDLSEFLKNHPADDQNPRFHPNSRSQYHALAEYLRTANLGVLLVDSNQTDGADNEDETNDDSNTSDREDSSSPDPIFGATRATNPRRASADPRAQNQSPVPGEIRENISSYEANMRPLVLKDGVRSSFVLEFLKLAESKSSFDYRQAQETMVADLLTMLEVPNYDENKQYYVLWEVWLCRPGITDTNEGLWLNEEIMAVLQGPEKKNKKAVVRYILKLEKRRQVPIKNIKWKCIKGNLDSYDYEDADLSPNIVQDNFKWNTNFINQNYTNGLFFYEYDIRNMPVNMRTLGSAVSLDTIGISCGRPFRFPEWMERNPARLEFFTTTYNIAAMPIIRNRNSQYNKSTLIASFNALYERWNPVWISLINSKRELDHWFNTFDISLLSNHKYSSLSAFNLKGSKTREQGATDDFANENAVANPNDITVSPNVYFLLPVPVNSMSRSITSWAAVSKKLRGPRNVDNSRWNPTTHKSWLQSPSFNEHASNSYQQLIRANGGQGIEHVGLSSVLGSGAHMDAALHAVRYIRKEHKPKAISEFSEKESEDALRDYTVNLPTIVDKIGKRLVSYPVQIDDMHSRCPQQNFVALEFPVYFLKDPIDGSFFYSRIDAITQDFMPEDKATPTSKGYAVWEYKTRWGNQEPGDNAEEPHIRQTAFYCFCLSFMLTQKIMFFYIRYVRASSPGDLHETTLNIYTYKYRYEPDPADSDKWNAKTAYRFLADLEGPGAGGGGAGGGG